MLRLGSILALSLTASVAHGGPPHADPFDELGGPAASTDRRDRLMGQLDTRSEVLRFVDAESGAALGGVAVELKYPNRKRSRIETFRATTNEAGIAHVPWTILEGAADRQFCLSARRSGYDHLRRSLGASEAVLAARGAGLRFLMVPAGRRGAVRERCALDIVEKLDRPETQITVQVHFGYGDHALTEKGRGQAAEIAGAMAAVCRTFPTARFLLRGHTDARGTAAYNRRLSLKRARSVAAHVSRLEPELGCPVRTEGAGEDEPAAMGDDEADHARNRRVEVVRLR